MRQGRRRPPYYIIEHPTRGTLQDNSVVGEVHWSWAGKRTDEDVMRFPTLTKAQETLKVLVPERLRERCYILAAPAEGEFEWVKQRTYKYAGGRVDWPA